MTRKPLFLHQHDPSKAIGRFTESGIEFNDGITPENFRALAFAVAGHRWKTRLGPMIGKCRTQVFEYSTGRRKVPKVVQLLMTELSKRR